MSAVYDRHEYIKDLTVAGLNEKQAEAIALGKEIKSIILALSLFITMPAAAQTVSLSASSDNGDRDTTRDDLQVAEGDTLTITLSTQGFTTEVATTRTMFSGSAYTETDVGPEHVRVFVQCRTAGGSSPIRDQIFRSRAPSDAEIRAICTTVGDTYIRTTSTTTTDRQQSYDNTFFPATSPRTWTFLIARDPDAGEETISAVTSLNRPPTTAGVMLGTASVTVTICISPDTFWTPF